MPKVSAHDAAIYAANDLITALTKPQPTNSFLSIGNDQLVALRQLATIFQSSITKKPISDPSVQDIAPPPPPPPHRPRTRSQTQKLANAALTAPPGATLFHTQPQPTNASKQEEDITEGLLEDPFPLIGAANSVTDPDTGQQLEYKQLINHPDSKLCQTWQRSSANEFGQLAQGVGGQIEGTETIKFLHYHKMPKNRCALCL